MHKSFYALRDIVKNEMDKDVQDGDVAIQNFEAQKWKAV